VSNSSQRREEARAEAARLREQQARAAKRRRDLVITLLVVGLLVVGGVVAWIVSNRPAPAPDFSGSDAPLSEVTLPAGATAEGGIPVGPGGVAGTIDGAAGDAVPVVVYADFMCPVCGTFEQTNGETLARLRESGDITLEYRLVAILDRFSQGTSYSTRAATAAGLVADRAPELFVAFHDSLFAHQPEENSSGLDDATLAGVARGVGVPEAVAATIEDGSYLEGGGSFSPWVAAATEQAGRDFPDGFGTPTILVDGQNIADQGVDWRVEGALADAIAAARG
jgi:protein-disulfide isomerase